MLALLDRCAFYSIAEERRAITLNKPVKKLHTIHTYKLLTTGAVLLILLCAGCRLLLGEKDERSRHDAEHRSWQQYGGSADQSKYVVFKQINKKNVGNLKPVWFYPTADQTQYLFNPVVVNNVMYVLAKNNSLVALDASTGKEIWIHARLNGITWKGVNYWESADRTDRRLLFCLNNTLQEIDAATGKSILSFGNQGSVSLREGLARDPATIGRVQSTTPGCIFEDLIILGSSPGENLFSAPGHIRAYNVITGKLVWTFHTIPLPGEYGYETWPKDAYKYVGGVNTWGEISLDKRRGIAYLPVGSPTYDYYGADRIGSNLFGDCLLALDARTGKRLWHFQMVHHDLWDYDPTAAPQLITVRHKGKKTDAVAQATKQGFLFAFDRITGEPLWPVEERPVPPSGMPEEQAWPTQPFPTVVPPFTRHLVSADDINPYFTAEEKESWKKRIALARTGMFVPPSDKYETIVIPGAVGGANFGNTAADPDKGIMYIASQDYPSVYKLTRKEEKGNLLSEEQAGRAKAAYTQNCQSCHGADRAGVVGPALVSIGARMNLDQFKTTVTAGRGQMPGFQHIDEATLSALYLFLGGEARPDARRQAAVQAGNALPEGPVVAFGGAPVAQGQGRFAAGMQDYPAGVARPAHQYTSDYGLQYPDLMAPVWSSLFAYDLNKGTIKWRVPLGQDARVSAAGGKNTGVAIGSQRKGMIVTATGLVFATSKGGMIRAFDADDGRILWSYQLPRETQGLLSCYEINGRQFIAVSATAPFTKESVDRSKEPGALPPGYMVFALPFK